MGFGEWIKNKIALMAFATASVEKKYVRSRQW